MIKFLSDNLWVTLHNLSKKSKRTKVAVAYFGKGASDQLNLKKGDILLVAMDLNNVRSGQVSPHEIQKLYDKGVSIFNLPNLHAKIYVFDKKAVITSANVSSHSANHLLEAAILTDDKTIFQDAELFIHENCIEKIEQDYIELCKENYNPPKNFGAKRQPQAKNNFRGKLSRLWVISTKPVDFTDDDYEVLKKEEAIFEKKISNKRTFELTDIKYPIRDKFVNSVNEGDILIEIVKHKVRTQVMQPKRALGVTFNKAKGRAYLRVEERKNPVTKGWTGLEKQLRQNGVKAVTKNSTREIKNENTKRILLNYFR
ncbi:MAG TPA: phospholipase D-like domain-containing protein [Flavisolibacter sp.]|nr:phospholipase D-like domain-containing protein [Flavisolibacter sp.]